MLQRGKIPAGKAPSFSYAAHDVRLSIGRKTDRNRNLARQGVGADELKPIERREAAASRNGHDGRGLVAGYFVGQHACADNVRVGNTPRLMGH